MDVFFVMMQRSFNVSISTVRMDKRLWATWAMQWSNGRQCKEASAVKTILRCGKPASNLGDIVYLIYIMYSSLARTESTIPEK